MVKSDIATLMKVWPVYHFILLAIAFVKDIYLLFGYSK